MAQDDDVSYWEEYYEDLNDITFSGYDVTTTNPNYSLLIVTMTFIIACFFFGVLVFPGSPFHGTFKATVARVHSKFGKKKTGQLLIDHLRPSTTKLKKSRNTEILDTEDLGNSLQEQSVIVESTNLSQPTTPYINIQGDDNDEDIYAKEDISPLSLDAHKNKGKPKEPLIDRVRSKLTRKKSRMYRQKVESMSVGNRNASMKQSSKATIELPWPSATPYLNTQTRLQLLSPKNSPRQKVESMSAGDRNEPMKHSSKATIELPRPSTPYLNTETRLQLSSPHSLFDTNAKKVEIKVNKRKGQRGKMRFRGNQNSMRELVAISVQRNKKRREHNVQARINVASPAANVQCTLGIEEGHILSDKRADIPASNGRLDFEDLTSYLSILGRPRSPEKSDSASDLSSLSNYQMDDGSSNSGSAYSGIDGNLWSEIKKIFHLGAPWLVQSLVTYGADIITVIIISHRLGLKYMICYSNVWFIIRIFHVVNDAWYDACYHHVNATIGLETEEGLFLSGTLIKIGMVGNFLLSIPASILAVICMPSIMTWFGYHNSVVDMSQSYAAVAVINNLLGTTANLFTFVLDIEGHAKFNAIFEFWEAFFSVGLTLIFVDIANPNLFQLGIFHLFLDILATAGYLYLTIIRLEWFKGYMSGIAAGFGTLNTGSIKKMVSMAFPLIADGIVGHIEDMVFTIFAIHQGPAETATWILLDYVWNIIEICPETLAEAAHSRILRHLSKGNTELAQEVAFFTIKVGTLFSIVGSFVLFIFGDFFVWCLSLDETLEWMLLEVMPYLCICQPFVSIGMTAMELNDALQMYKKTVATTTVVTFVLLIPLGALFTYGYHYNIEGLAAAQCMGYSALGVANIVIFMNANWEKAVKKTIQIGSTSFEG
mmetsp:Transcript_12106/g.17668  ORF Transcript_12106/g.17668 Transcript_12106/m.17668 type:complete len:882 (-) Transcript_12106:94-2739(-)